MQSKIIYSEALSHKTNIYKHADGTWSTDLHGEWSQQDIKNMRWSEIQKKIRNTASMLIKLMESK